MGIRLMSLLTPGLQSDLLPSPTFILGSLVRCLHQTTFPWNQGVRIMPFWIRLLLTSNKAWTPILTDPLKTLELDTSLDEPDAVPSSSVSSGFLHSISTLSDNSKLQLAPSI